MYLFVQQQQASVGDSAGVLTLSTPAMTVANGNLLVVTVLCGYAELGSLVVSGYSPIRNSNNGTNGRNLSLYYAQNAAAGPTVVTANVSVSATLKAIYVAEYSGLATSSALIASNASAGAIAPGVANANSITSGIVTNSVSAMQFGFTFDQNGTAVLATAGTSPTAFTGRAGVWSALNVSLGGTGPSALAEDATVSGSAAGTFGTVTGNQFDGFMTVSADFALAPTYYSLESNEYY